MLLNSTDLLSSDFVSCMMNIISYVYALIFLLSLVLIKVLFFLLKGSFLPCYCCLLGVRPCLETILIVKAGYIKINLYLGGFQNAGNHRNHFCRF